MRISDWSSDVCSSDLAEADIVDQIVDGAEGRLGARHRRADLLLVGRVGDDVEQAVAAVTGVPAQRRGERAVLRLRVDHRQPAALVQEAERRGATDALRAAGPNARSALETPALKMLAGRLVHDALPPDGAQAAIGRASCRERVCPYVYISVVAGP